MQELACESTVGIACHERRSLITNMKVLQFEQDSPVLHTFYPLPKLPISYLLHFPRSNLRHVLVYSSVWLGDVQPSLPYQGCLMDFFGRPVLTGPSCQMGSYMPCITPITLVGACHGIDISSCPYHLGYGKLSESGDCCCSRRSSAHVQGAACFVTSWLFSA